MAELQTHFRTHTCGELRADHVGQQTTLAGFVEKTLDDGSFVLRDSHGKTFVLVGPRAPEAARDTANVLNPEDVVQVKGEVARRVKTNTKLATGEIYISPAEITVLSEAEPLPPAFEDEEVELDERLRNRQLDLRRSNGLRDRLQLRAGFTLAMRRYLAGCGFVEVETPLLGPWSPEQTASYLAPAGPDLTYALPGTPQAYKQLLIAGGCDRYFQIARCFRKEEQLTPERQPEYSVLDVEMSCIDEADLFPVVDGLLDQAFRALVGHGLELPIPQLTYAEAMLRFGTDRPDLRFGLELSDFTTLVRAVPEGGAARGLRVPGGGARLADDELEPLRERFSELGDYTLSWARVGEGGALEGPGAGDFQPAATTALEAEAGDLVMAVSAPHQIAAAQVAGSIRLLFGQRLGLIDATAHELVWVVRFPFFEFDPDAEAWATCRHPWTQPIAEHIDWVTDDEKKHAILTKSFDLVLDGVELGAGSIRNHDLELQRRIFKMFEYPDDEVEGRFGTVLNAFRYGVPPHGGLAIGLDRLVALLLGFEALEAVLAFPKSEEGRDLLLDAPSALDEEFVTAYLTP